ncbi:MAG: AraC family ligand binding domain-containing protein [Waltera sp.]
MAKSKRAVTEYRSYYLPTHFPVLLLSGDYWKISDIPSGSLHFHNCLEIGICHSDSGTLEINGEKQTFHAGDVTVLPRNVPHTTYSAPGTKATGLIFSWIRRNCSAISSPPPGKITTCPRTVSQHSVIFSAKRLFPTSTIWYLISSTSWKSRIPAIRSVPEACYAPFILNCTGSKVSAVSIPTRPNRTLLKYWPYRNVKKKARSPKTLW